MRIIRDTQPKIAIAENVKNLVGKKFEKEFALILQSLDEAGYDTVWKVMNAKDYGIPQSRERVFIISFRKDLHVDTMRVLQSIPAPIPLELRLKDMLEETVDDKYYLSSKLIKYFNQHKKHHDEAGNGFGWVPTDGNVIANAITAGTYKIRQCDNFILEPEVIQIANVCPTKTRDNPNQGRVYEPGGISPALNCMGGGNRQPWVPYEELEAGLRRVRRLTPKECWRLMGFDDEDFEAAAKVVSNTQLYKQAGNSIVVNTLEYLL